MTTAEIDRLSPQERLDLIGALWDSLSTDDVGLTPVQEAELGRRMATFDSDRQEAVAWEIVVAELDARAR